MRRQHRQARPIRRPRTAHRARQTIRETDSHPLGRRRARDLRRRTSPAIVLAIRCSRPRRTSGSSIARTSCHRAIARSTKFAPVCRRPLSVKRIAMTRPSAAGPGQSRDRSARWPSTAPAAAARPWRVTCIGSRQFGHSQAAPPCAAGRECRRRSFPRRESMNAHAIVGISTAILPVLPHF